MLQCSLSTLPSLHILIGISKDKFRHEYQYQSLVGAGAEAREGVGAGVETGSEVGAGVRERAGAQVIAAERTGKKFVAKITSNM